MSSQSIRPSPSSSYIDTIHFSCPPPVQDGSNNGQNWSAQSTTLSALLSKPSVQSHSVSNQWIIRITTGIICNRVVTVYIAIIVPTPSEHQRPELYNGICKTVGIITVNRSVTIIVSTIATIGFNCTPKQHAGSKSAQRSSQSVLPLESLSYHLYNHIRKSFLQQVILGAIWIVAIQCTISIIIKSILTILITSRYTIRRSYTI